jgi:PPOX class probable F420-dependent enzyme
MDLDLARDFARHHHHAVLATRSPGGGVQQSPVLVTVDDEGRFVVSSRETAYKTRNVRLDPWAQLCVLPDGFFGDWVYLEGRVEVLSLPEAEESLVGYYRAASGEHPDWAEYRASLHDQRRVALLLTAERAGPDRSG